MLQYDKSVMVIKAGSVTLTEVVVVMVETMGLWW